MRVQPQQLRLYAVTDRAWAADTDAFFAQIEAAIDGGAAFVQLREKHLGQDDFLAEARRFVALCREKGAVSIINDNVEIAAEVGADGVHVGQEDLACGRARAILGPDKIIGVSAHNVEEALAAQAAGADYLGVGAAFVSHTKGDAKPIAAEAMAAITAAVDIPVVAIGGITRENLPTLAGRGLDGVAVVSALFAQKDVKAAAAELRRLAEAIARYAKADKINYAIYGDIVSHFHVHVVPKTKDGLQWGGPFTDNIPKVTMEPEAFQAVGRAVLSAMDDIAAEKGLPVVKHLM